MSPAWALAEVSPSGISVECSDEATATGLLDMVRDSLETARDDGGSGPIPGAADTYVERDGTILWVTGPLAHDVLSVADDLGHDVGLPYVEGL